MKKDTDREITNIDGSTLIEGDKPVRMKNVLVAALLAPGAESSTGEEKARRYKLALAASSGGEIDYSPEDLVLIKRVVGAVYGPLVVGQVYEWADG